MEKILDSKIFIKYNIVSFETAKLLKNIYNKICKFSWCKTNAFVNENDTISTYEIKFGDNDTLSAIVAALIDADLLILLSDIDGLYTDNPRSNPDAKFIEVVEELTDDIMHMGKSETGSNVGTGGMNTKLQAAKICLDCGCDMIITNGNNPNNLYDILDGKSVGTTFTEKSL